MGQAVVVYETPDILITIDSDQLELMSKEEVVQVIHEALHTAATGKSDFFGDVTEGSNPPPVYTH